jgi:hypothetical protein
MNSSVKFFEPIVTDLPLFAELDWIVPLGAAVVEDPPAELDVLVLLLLLELPQAASTTEAAITTSALTRCLMRFPSFC